MALAICSDAVMTTAVVWLVLYEVLNTYVCTYVCTYMGCSAVIVQWVYTNTECMSQYIHILKGRKTVDCGVYPTIHVVHTYVVTYVFILSGCLAMGMLC